MASFSIGKHAKGASKMFKVALVIVWLANGVGGTSQGATSLYVPVKNTELCEKQKPRILKELNIQPGWVSASCVVTSE